MVKIIKKYLSGSLKIVLAGIVAISANIALANPDLTKSENYFPGGKYDLFNGGRFARQGSKIVDVNNNIQVSGPSFQTGSVRIHLQQYSGEIEFERSFENHPLSVHGSWRRTNSKQLPFFHGNISGESLGIGVSRGTIYGVEIHPQDAYDAKDGGDHPYDIYNYRVSGSSITTSINPPNLPTLLPAPPISPNQNNNNQDNKTENNDNRREEQIRQENADSQGENDAIAENGELTPQQDTYYDDTCIGCDADPNGYNYDGGSFYNAGCFDSDCIRRSTNPELYAEWEGAGSTGTNLTKIYEQINKKLGAVLD